MSRIPPSSGRGPSRPSPEESADAAATDHEVIAGRPGRALEMLAAVEQIATTLG